MIVALLLLLTAFAPADPPKDVLQFIQSTAETLANNNPRGFVDKFDPAWGGYKQLRADVEDLLARAQVGSSIEIVSDEGDDQKRSLELDWLLLIEGAEQRHKIVKCRIEKQGKRWRIVALEPARFFKY
jgi:hypothetical protein